MHIFLFILFALFASSVLAQTTAEKGPAADKGRAIAAKAEAADSGWQDAKAGLLMQLATKSGQSATRQLAFQSLEAKGGDQSLIRFVAPKDVQDTALLTHAKASGPDDQWIYLPALKRTTRISGTTKASPFMGSEFAYEDFVAADVDKFSYSFVRDEACGALICAVVERVPAYEGSGYAKQTVWIDTAAWRIQKIDFTNKRGQLAKTLTASSWKQFQGRFWRAQELLMVNHLTGATTTLKWSDFAFKTGLSPQSFSSSNLGR
jgi:outer membrane lipoprotein-sorting protein